MMATTFETKQATTSRRARARGVLATLLSALLVATMSPLAAPETLAAFAASPDTENPDGGGLQVAPFPTGEPPAARIPPFPTPPTTPR